MTNAMTIENTSALPAVADEIDNILAAASEHAGFPEMLKYKKGQYVIGEDTVPLNTQYLAHPEAWTKCWLKFTDGKVAERRPYPMSSSERPPERHEMGDEDQTAWSSGFDGRPADPWCLQSLLPLENPLDGKIVVFTTSSVGGNIAVNELCSAWAKRRKKGNHGQPIVKLQSTEMPTKNFGKIPRPEFVIVDWNDADGDVLVASPAISAADEMDDSIPF